ncbi:MAG: Chloride channel core [Acidobacteriaceae bacterium]|nr:Chloride channel core [Acidobacteriaceae bacterium]
MLTQYLSRRTPTASEPEAAPQLTPVFWLLVVLIGVVSGLASGLLIRMLHVIGSLAYNGHTGNMLEDVASASSFRRIAVLTLAGIILSLFMALERHFKIRPPISAASTTESPRTLPTLAEAFVSILTVGMGVPLGREAALREAASLVAARISDRAPLTPQQRKLLIACGAGAGMAAAYNVPFAGAIFAVEIVLGSFSIQAVLAATATSCIATACSWLLLPNVPAYQVPALPFTVSALVFALLAGPFCGVGSAAFVRLIAWACRHRPRGGFVLIAPIIVLTCVGVASLPYPELLGNGKEAIQSIFSNRETVPALVVLLFLRPIATVASLRSGALGGLFTPVMSIGAILGSLIAGLWVRVASLLHLGVPADNALTFAFIGAGATLAAGTQAPLSAVLFLLEMTHRGDALLIPLLLAVALAILTHSRIANGSIFSARRSLPTAPQLSENSCASSS